MLRGRKILLGVCGSIAAYKSAMLIRLLVKAGNEVKVVMTSSAADFITPLTLSTLSKSPVAAEFTKDDQSWNSHVELGLWADIFIIAPASANSIAKFANGICDNMLTATYLSAKCPVFIAPAMDVDMWHHPATQKNIKTLEGFGCKIVPVNSGELASGLVGEGRMAEPEEIIAFLEKTLFGGKKGLPAFDKIRGKRVLITAGPTIEPIDPVRYISNYSSGKMGFALADRFIEMGADVTMIKGPTSTNPSLPGVKIIPVTTAGEMYEASVKNFKHADITVMAAAVSDYTPANQENKKIKKEGDALNLNLKKTVDILQNLSEQKRDNQVLVGFALETDNELKNAKDKLKNKNLDLIVLNSLNDKGAGFGHDTNKITIINKKGQLKKFPLKTKIQVARDIISEIVNLLDA